MLALLSGLYPRNPLQDPVPRRLASLALWAWFTWFASWGWALYDLMRGVPVVAIFGNQPIPYDQAHIDAAIPRWVAQLSLHFLSCLGIHVAQLVHALNLPFHKLRPIRAALRDRDPLPTKAELLAALLDDESKRGGLDPDTVRAFLTHADLADWPTREKVLRGWLRLLLTDLDEQVRRGTDIVELAGRRETSSEMSMRLNGIRELLQRGGGARVSAP